MKLNLKTDNLEYKYRLYFIFAAQLIMLFYSVFNITIERDLFKFCFCISLAVLLFIENGYYILKGKLLFNNLISLCGIFIFLLLIPIFGENPERGRLWIFLIPPACFYTQTIKNSLIIVISYIVWEVIASILSSRNLIPEQKPYTLEYMFVFLLISLISLFYEMVLKRKKITINRQLYCDPLTGLSNRNKLLLDLGNTERIILILINLDDFKEVNDLLGSVIGDSALVHVSRLLKNSSKEFRDIKLYRLHADEFAVIMPLAEKNSCNEFVYRLYKDIIKTFNIETYDLSITVSIGISIDSEKPLEEADMALKKAKETNKNVVFFDPSLNTAERYNNNRIILLLLRKAIKEDNIMPFFQPLYNISSGRITRYEALVRILDNDSVYLPDSFLKISQRAKIYPKITRRMVRKSLELFSFNNLDVSINLSLEDLYNKKTVECIYAALAGFNNPSRVIFELLETDHIKKSDEVISFIHNVHKIGCKVAIDDFGSGYSNFNYLLALNVDIIKIDASLIENIALDSNSYTITRNIINFAREMNIQTVAEYVHNEEVLATVTAMGVDYAQGFFIGKPEPSLSRTSIKAAIQK